jgi:hypothetical protein|tara:strand:+ start:160 stop:567 length:408 start_codon:yes stop_codon:yes gene_type:complete
VRCLALFTALLLLPGCSHKSPTKTPPPEESIYPIYAFVGERGIATWYLICEDTYLIKRYLIAENLQVYESRGRLRDGRAIRDEAWGLHPTTRDTINYSPVVYDLGLEFWGDKVVIGGAIYRVTEKAFSILGTCEE